MAGSHRARLHCAAHAALLLVPVLGAAAQAPIEDPVIARVLDIEIRASQRGQLRDRVLGPLLDNYRRDRGIEATPDEIELFIVKYKEKQEKISEQWRAEIAEIEHRLDTELLDPKERQRLDERLDRLRQHLEPKPVEVGRRRGLDKLRRALREKVARQNILAWKTNKAFYKEYGGRVIFKQAGPEPLDAYRKFLEEQAAAGSFEILDSADKQEFWSYFHNDSIHAFVDPGGAEIFATPWWLLDDNKEGKGTYLPRLRALGQR